MSAIKKAWPWLLLSICVIAIDQFSKLYLNTHLTLGQPVEVLPFFNLTLAYNPGAAFSFLGEQTGWQIWLFTSISLAISIILIAWLLKTPRKDALLACSLSLILGGAVGNLIDRVLYGYVIDFADFHIGSWHFATFNIADSAVCIGAGLLIVHLIFFSKK